ncbi:MAG: cell division protein FtsH, partial [Pseudanabaena sp.]
VTTGAGGDLQQVSGMARQMVTRFGMSNIGQLALEGQSSEVFLGRSMGGQSPYSEDVSAKIDQQVREIVQKCYQTALQIVYENRTAIDRVVDLLVDNETLDGDEFRRIISEYTSVPVKERFVPQI